MSAEQAPPAQPVLFPKRRTDPNAASYGIVNVWNGNLYTEIESLSNVVAKYPIVALDTEFPGMVTLPPEERNKRWTYDTVRLNVEHSQLIQAGLSFFSETGEQPEGKNTWQFNFKFVLGVNPILDEAYELLSGAGLDFKRFATDGIDRSSFAERLLISGVLLNPDVKWLTFQGGFDYAYLMRIITNTDLPRSRDDFLKELKYYFPVTYDVRQMVKVCGMFGGLQATAETLEPFFNFKVERKGVAHQAGSDSMITGLCFFKLREVGGHYCIHLSH
ncbi:CCR4 NOT transcription complex subunit 7 [Trichuris trichiura]|uniref:poly(A)-specific ribonuclease n=1 Tax=Trichuris trichiura TaxID=36087 RepID=A0A077Z7J3_TRITR|nr:CCR4 NOT transcription complex subunit 7 [Trichuris trichiura]